MAPRSPRALAKIRRNAVRHGLRASAVVIPGIELREDWETFLNDAIEALDPIGAVEYALAERAATLLWRLRRAARAERDAAIAFGKRRDGDESVDGPLQMFRAGTEFARQFYAPLDEDRGQPLDIPAGSRPRLPAEPPAALPAADVLQTLSKYEFRLSRQLRHALLDLQVLQDRRHGYHTPTARIDVQGLPEVD